MKDRFNDLLALLRNMSRQPLLTLLINPTLKERIEPLFFKLRWLIPVALLCRYLLHEDKGINFLVEGSFYILLLFFIAYLLFSEIKFRTLNKRKDATAHEWRLFSSWFTSGDIAFITLFYILSRSPRSDIPYLYVIPIVWSTMFMPIRNNLFGLFAVSLLYFIGSIVTIYMSSSVFNFSELLLVLMPKVIFFPILVLYLLWVHVKLKLSEKIIEALFDKSAEGISFIGQKKSRQVNTLIDMQVLNLNSSQQMLTPNAKKGGGLQN